MKLIESSAEYIPQDYTYEGITKHIEKCARVCYKSENKQSKSFEDSEKFVKRLIDSGHTSMLEHGTVYLTERWKTDNDNFPESKFKHNPYSKVIELYPYQHNKLCNPLVLIHHSSLKHYLSGTQTYFSVQYSFLNENQVYKISILLIQYISYKQLLP